MLGMPDAVIAAAYVLCVASTLLCVAYGIVNWKRGDDSEDKKEIEWESHEQQIEEIL